MAIWQAVNVLTNAVEGVKFVEVGTPAEIWAVTLPVSLANGDTILGPSLPAGCFLCDLGADCTSLDSSTGLLFTVGTALLPAQFITATNVGQGATGGVAKVNVGGSLGFTAAVNTQIVATITHAASVPVQGKFTFYIEYTASP